MPWRFVDGIRKWIPEKAGHKPFNCVECSKPLGINTDSRFCSNECRVIAAKKLRN